MTVPAVTWREEPDSELVAADDPRRDIRIGAAIGFFFFVVLLGWAAFAPLDAGVYAQGSIAVSGNRQAVQNREGFPAASNCASNFSDVKASFNSFGQLLLAQLATK